MTELHIRLFEPHDQAPAKALILQGLGEHFGFVDETLNPDLSDIAQTYAAHTFLCAFANNELVGTGAYVKINEATCEIKRMSVKQAQRRLHIGTHLLNELLRHAAQHGFRRAILETNATWHQAIAFYERNGFCITHRVAGEFGEEVYFERAIEGR